MSRFTPEQQLRSAEVMLDPDTGGELASLVDALEEEARRHARKAEALWKLAADVKANGATWGPEGFVTVASRFVHESSYVGSGPEHIAVLTSRCAANAAVLSYARPERHDQ